VFRHFGSGTLKGAATYFADRFLVNPAMFRQEWEELAAMGITPKVYCRSSVRIITVMDMYANVYLEKLRGDKSHSSTGCGVWEALNRHQTLSNEKNVYAFSDIIAYYEELFKKWNHGTIDDEAQDWLHGAALMHNSNRDLQFFYEHVEVIEDDVQEKALFHSYPLIVFENGQGLLLDDSFCLDYDHNTPAYVGTKVPADLIAKNFVPAEVQIEPLYVTRSYLTRHGKGQVGITGNCECDKDTINPDMVDLTNVPNPNQGTLRYGKFTFEEADAAVARAINDNRSIAAKGFASIPSVVITHMNEYRSQELWGAVASAPVKAYVSTDESKISRRRNYYT
jgi:adenylosuccinate synthase